MTTQYPWARFEKGLADKADEFYEALDNRDVYQASQIVTELGTERKLVDYGLVNVMGEDDNLLSFPHLKPRIPTQEEYKLELASVDAMSHLRDKPLTEIQRDELPHLTDSQFEGLTRVSWFLQGVVLEPYKAGVDHKPSDEMLAGKSFADRPNDRDAETTIITGRHAATYVHHDNPVTQWITRGGTTDPGVLELLLRLKAPYNRGPARGVHQGDFACWGYPFLAGLFGHTLMRLGVLSFKQKWEYRAARPEHYGISQVFPEGSPMHGDVNAMHYLAARVLSKLALVLFDDQFKLPNGETIGFELDLMHRNIAQWRLAAGVHTAYANSCSESLADVLVDRIVNWLPRARR